MLDALASGELDFGTMLQDVQTRHDDEVHGLPIAEQALYHRLRVEATEGNLRDKMTETLGRTVGVDEGLHAVLRESLALEERRAADAALLANDGVLELTRHAVRWMAHVCHDPAAVRAYAKAADRATLARVHRAFEGASELERIRWLDAAVDDDSQPVG